MENVASSINGNRIGSDLERCGTPTNTATTRGERHGPNNRYSGGQNNRRRAEIPLRTSSRPRGRESAIRKPIRPSSCAKANKTPFNETSPGPLSSSSLSYVAVQLCCFELRIFAKKRVIALEKFRHLNCT